MKRVGREGGRKGWKRIGRKGIEKVE